MHNSIKMKLTHATFTTSVHLNEVASLLPRYYGGYNSGYYSGYYGGYNGGAAHHLLLQEQQFALQSLHVGGLAATSAARRRRRRLVALLVPPPGDQRAHETLRNFATHFGLDVL